VVRDFAQTMWNKRMVHMRMNAQCSAIRHSRGLRRFETKRPLGLSRRPCGTMYGTRENIYSRCCSKAFSGLRILESKVNRAIAQNM
jgi:hypothetical protein